MGIPFASGLVWDLMGFTFLVADLELGELSRRPSFLTFFFTLLPTTGLLRGFWL